MQAEAERVTCIIHPVDQKVHDEVTFVEKFMLEHVNSDMVENMWKKEEEVRTEAKKVVKIVEYFLNKISVSHNMEQ